MSVLRTQLRGVARRPARLLLTGLAVVVAAFFAFAVMLAQQITERTVVASISGIPAATSLVVADGDGSDTDGRLMPAAALATVRQVPGVAEVTGRLRESVPLAGSSEGALFTFFADPGSGPLAQVRVVAGAYPDGPGEVAVTRRTAQRFGLNPGGTVSIAPAGNEPVALAVTAVVEAPGDDGYALYATDAFAEKVFGSGYGRLDLRADPGTPIGALQAEVANALRSVAPEARVIGADAARAAQAQRVVAEIEPIFALLGMFVLVAVVAAALVAASTFRIVFTQRMRQLALLRAVGATRGRLVRSLAAEGLFTGLVAGVAGVLAAGGLAQLAPLVSGAFGKKLADPGFPVGQAVGVVVGAVVVTLLAVAAPAISASRVSPLEALRASAVADGRRGIGILRLLAGGLLALAAAGIAAQVFAAAPDPGVGPGPDYDTEQQLLLTVLSGTLAFGALLALGPVVVPPVLRLVGWPLRRGTVGRLAVGGVGGAPRRAAAVSAVVALGVTLIGGTLVGAASLQRLADAELAGSYPADIEVAGTGDGATLPVEFADRLRRHRELARVVPYRRSTIRVEAAGRSVELRATDLDPRALPATRRLQVAQGSLGDVGAGRVVLGLAVVKALGIRAGDTVQLGLGDRRAQVRVSATLAGSAPLGTLLAHSTDFDKLGVPRTPSGVLVDAAAAGESGRSAAEAAVRAELGGVTGFQLDVLADARDEVLDWLNMLTVAALGLLGLTVLIAVVGVGTTTALSVVERVRESGLLRAVGLSRAGLKGMVTTEAGLYGLLGSAIGLALGVPYAWLAVLALGINAPLLAPAAELAAVVVAVAGLTAVAGLLPARRAAKASPVAALGVE